MAASFQPPSHLFERNISLNDLDLALNVREIVRKDVVVPEEATKHRHLGSSTSYSFVLPSLQNLDEEFRKFVFSFLVDGHILRELETARRLNWCITLCRMVTVNTLGDGNCLMHAASIGMWAVNDRYQTLRKTVYEALVEDVEGFYHSRWKSEEQHQILLNQIGGYERTEEQWAHEWEEVIRHISQNEFPYGPNGAQFGSLEEIHIFVLANILRRTIIVVSDETLRGQFGDSYAPINFGGIYLPLLWDSVDCVKSPLVIGYADGHFTAVVSIEDGKLDLGLESQSAPPSSSCVHAVPLVKGDGTPLPVHFLYDHEAPLASDRLRQYLDCAKVPFAGNPGEPKSHILVAKLHFAEQPSCMKDLVEGYFAKAREEYQRVSRNRQLSSQFQPGNQLPALKIVQCQTQGCDFYGSTETGNRCSKCLNEYLRSLAPACEPNPPGQIPTGQQQRQQKQQNPPHASSSSSSMNLSLAKSVKCSTTGCKYGAVANRGGLCERCFEAERSAAELAASMNPMSLASSKQCANHSNGCEFFGLPQHHDLCSRCYRSFCLRMENTLGVSSPTGLPPTSPTATMANHCQNPGCRHPGVPALYGMCVQCYSGCIHSFITSEGRSVGSVTQVSPHFPPPPPPANITKKAPLPTGAGKKGVLCASPGCLNEGVFQLGDLCAECFERKSGPSPQMRTNLVPATTAAAVNFPVTQPPPSTVSASVTVAPTYHLTSALTSVIGNCSNPTCPNKTGKEGKSLCQRCEQWIASITYRNPTASSLQPCRPVDVVTATSSTAASMSPAQMTPANTSVYSTPASSSSQQARTSHQVVAATAFPNPSAQVPAGPCAMGCGKPSAQDSGLCEQCYVAAFELELNRQTAPQPSRQQGATASSISNNQVEQRNTNVPASSARGLQQQTEASAATKKQALMPCTSTGCLRFGMPGENGLCEECFRKKGNPRPSATASQGNQQQISSNGHSLYNTRATEQSRQLVGSSLPATSALKEPIQVCQSQSPPYRAGVRRHDSNSGDVEENVQGQRCRGTNCTLFGTTETYGYCSRCFLESTIPQSGPSSIPDFPSEVSSLSIPQDRSLPEQCRVTGCDNFAAPERHGHCEDCFRRFYPEVIYREGFTQRQMSELSESSN